MENTITILLMIIYGFIIYKAIKGIVIFEKYHKETGIYDPYLPYIWYLRKKADKLEEKWENSYKK